MLDQLNERSLELCKEAGSIDEVSVEHGGQVLHFAPDGIGSQEAGILLARICMSDLATVSVESGGSDSDFQFVHVSTKNPLLACIASQYAGWPFSNGKYFAMCSGPARIGRGQEDILTEYNLVSQIPSAIGILETKKLPSAEDLNAFAKECNVAPEKVTLCIAPTSSLACMIQIAARSVETALHKLHELDFDLNQVVRGSGSAPIPPRTKDDMVAMGWTNDSILYGGKVTLEVECDDSLIQKMGPSIPSSYSDDFGRPFGEVFSNYDYDFYKVDKMLFSPAEINVTNLATGSEFCFGKLRFDILERSFSLNAKTQ